MFRIIAAASLVLAQALGIWSPAYAAHEAGAVNTMVNEIVFVDARIDDRQSMIDALNTDTSQANRMVVVTGDDMLGEMDRILAQHHNLAKIHIIAHGAPGQLNLGKATLVRPTLQDEAARMARWGKALSSDGGIYIYGCELAKGENGEALVQRMADYAGRPIFASNTATGNAQKGGDWTLEYAARPAEAAKALKLPTYQGLLWTTQAWAGGWYGDLNATITDRRQPDTSGVGFSSMGFMTGGAGVTQTTPVYNGTSVFRATGISATNITQSVSGNQYIGAALTVDPAATAGVRISQITYNQVANTSPTTDTNQETTTRVQVAIYDPTGTLGTNPVIISSAVATRGTLTTQTIPLTSQPVLMPGVAYEIRFYFFDTNTNATNVAIFDNPIINVQYGQAVRLRKTWVGAAVGDSATINVTGSGTSSFTATATQANETLQQAQANWLYLNTGNSVTFAETLAATNTGGYTPSLACSGNTNALSGSSLTIAAADRLITCTYTNNRKPEITLYKKTAGSTGGPFTFTLTNTTLASNSVTTTTADTATQVDGNTTLTGANPFIVSSVSTPVTISESTVAPDFVLDTSATYTSCKNSGGTTVGSYSGASYTIPTGALTTGAQISCEFLNRPEVKLSMTKTNTPAAGNVDQNGDTVISGTTTTYTVTARNIGAQPADGATVQDTPGAGLSSCVVTNCTASGSAQCPATPGNIMTGPTAIPTFPAGSTVTFTVQCNFN